MTDELLPIRTRTSRKPRAQRALVKTDFKDPADWVRYKGARADEKARIEARINADPAFKDKVLKEARKGAEKAIATGKSILYALEKIQGKSGIGRPTEWTTEIEEKIFEMVHKGCSEQTAVHAVGIDHSTLIERKNNDLEFSKKLRAARSSGKAFAIDKAWKRGVVSKFNSKLHMEWLKKRTTEFKDESKTAASATVNLQQNVQINVLEGILQKLDSAALAPDVSSPE